MTSIYWIVRHLADVPECDDWLSPDERAVRARLWAPKRVRDWRLGRWTAKQALLRAGGGDASRGPELDACARISILAMDTGGPHVLENGAESAWALSLSHAGEHGLSVLARRPAAVGCDIETVGRRGEEFVVDWFTDAERALVDSMREVEDRSRLVTTVWSAKESALKALGVGLRMDTRDVNVELLTDRPQTPDVGLQAPDAGQRTPDSGLRAREEWSPLMVTCSRGSFHGWSRTCGDHVLTLVADPPPDIPVAL